MYYRNVSIFTKIINREIPASIVYETETVIAFRDVNPQAPTHILIVPKKEIRSLEAATVDDQLLMGELLLSCREVADREKLGENYRVVINTGESVGQSVFHIHLHLLSGRTFEWPPG